MINKRIKSFGHAFQGLAVLIKEEHNARIHLLATTFVVGLGFSLQVSKMEWCLILLAIGLVIAMEAINSSLENLADFVSPQKHPLIKKVKDLAAGGVLVAAITAAIIGCIIFLPKII